MAPRFGAMGSSALFLQMVEGPLPECTADDRAGIVGYMQDPVPFAAALATAETEALPRK